VVQKSLLNVYNVKEKISINKKAEDKLMSNKIRYGFIGFGRFAENTMLPAVLESPNSEIIAVQNRKIEKAKEKAAEYKIFRLHY
jgi:hypothetical protein